MEGQRGGHLPLYSPFKGRYCTFHTLKSFNVSDLFTPCTIPLPIRAFCQADLPAQDCEELEAAILSGDAMDSQVMSVIKRFPNNFNIGMVPDMETNFAPPHCS